MSSARPAATSTSPARAAPRDLLGTLEQLLDIQEVEERPALLRASNIISAALGADKVDIFFYDEGITSLVARGTSQTPMGNKQLELGLDRLPLANGGRSVEVYLTGKPYLCGRADLDTTELPGLVHGLGIRSRLAVALEIAAERRGTIEVCSATPDLWSEADQRFLSAAARWIGSWLHRFELGAEMQRQALEEGRRKAAEEIFAVLAHDLRNILASAKLRLTLLRQRAVNEARELDLRDAGLLDSSLRRLVQLTNNLLDVSRLERGVFSLDTRLIDLVALVRQAIAALDRSDIRIDARLPESALVNGDPERLAQAIENLLSNAIKFSPAGGRVEVALSLTSDDADPRCVLRVRDQGPGIPEALLPRIFDRYVSGKDSRGLGIGLYLARGIAVAHGGTLTAQAGPGAVFELTLPVLAAET